MPGRIGHMPASSLLTLAAGPASVVLDPENGGRLASWTVWGMQLLEPRNDGNHPYGWGSYPMVPYAGRIRHGEFAFDGKHHAMPITMAHIRSTDCPPTRSGTC